MKLSPVRWLWREGGRGRVRLGAFMASFGEIRRRGSSLTFFCGQGIFLLRLRLLQLGLVEAGHLGDVGLVRHG